MSTENSSKPKAKTGFSNPALKAMGISNIRLPSRNWMIFGTILTVSLSGALYDKQKQKQSRQRYIEDVSEKSKEVLDIYKKPRKITVFIAPPPSDYLETSLKFWKRYIKPVLYYSGLDYDIVEEHRQGVIRTEVANRIRDVRKRLIEQKTAKTENDSKTKDFHSDDVVASDSDNGKEFKKSFDYRNIMGIFFKNSSSQKVITEDSMVSDPTLSGGVICLGRGAYIEYINGLHEGLLGPLDPPKEEVQLANVEEILFETSEARSQERLPEPSLDLTPNVPTDNDEIKKQESTNEEESENENEIKQVLLKPFINSDDYSNTEIPLEISEALLENNNVVRDPKDNIPILLHQPVLVLKIPNLIGFLNIPERIYRFYNKRYLAEDICSSVADLINQRGIREFKDPADLDLAKEEEIDWPSKWVKQGKERKSEWTRGLTSDSRIVGFVYIINKELENENSSSSIDDGKK